MTTEESPKYSNKEDVSMVDDYRGRPKIVQIENKSEIKGKQPARASIYTEGLNTDNGRRSNK